MQRIFIVEDNIKLRNELKVFLEKYGYECVTSDDFDNIVKRAVESKPHLILLDVNLPVYDGYYVCREIRKDSDVPIIVVTSRNTEMDELMSMNLGADDFVTKPYNTQILLARISSILKRTYNVISVETMEHNRLKFETTKSIVRYGDKECELTKNESKILNILMKNGGKIVSRDKIMEELWESEAFIDDNTLTVNVNRLRKKLESIDAKDFIQTKKGQGYILV